MPRPSDPQSVSSLVSVLEVGHQVEFINPYPSIMVMVSQLKSKPNHKHKTFKIKSVDGKTIVSRIK